MISFFDSPSRSRREAYAFVRSLVRMRETTTTCSAALAWRCPPRLSRWRTVFPDDAGIGLAPQSIAKLASDRRRDGLSPAVTRNSPADSTPTHGSASNLGASSSTSGSISRSRSAISSLSARMCGSSDQGATGCSILTVPFHLAATTTGSVSFAGTNRPTVVLHSAVATSVALRPDLVTQPLRRQPLGNSSRRESRPTPKGLLGRRHGGLAGPHLLQLSTQLQCSW